jgi:formate hydrogenlyase subunit 3/multisubunit Na+/H+ antiporter MnhD subunit
VTFLVLLAGIFLGMSDTVMQVAFGNPSHRRTRISYHDTFATTAPMVAALLFTVVLGLWLPRPAAAMLQGATALAEGRP